MKARKVRSIDNLQPVEARYGKIRSALVSRSISGQSICSFMCCLLFFYSERYVHIISCVTVYSFRILFLSLFILLHVTLCSFARSCLYFDHMCMLLFVLLVFFISSCLFFYVLVFVLFHVIFCTFTCYCLFF